MENVTGHVPADATEDTVITACADRPDDTAAVDDSTLIRHVRRLTLEADRFTQHFGHRHALHRTDLTALVLVLDADGDGHPLSQGDLAHTLGLSASATTSVLDRLQEAGYVERRRDTLDRRRIVLRVREPALELGRALFTPLRRAYARAWRQFDDAERHTIARFLATTVDATVHTTAAPEADPTR